MRTIEVQYMVEAAVTADNTCDTKPLRVGLDIGSTTVKAVVLDQTDSLDAVLFSDYRRHHANVRATVAGLLEDIHKELEARGRGDEPIRLAITGSGGLALADNLHVPFVRRSSPRPAPSTRNIRKPTSLSNLAVRTPRSHI